MPGPIGIAIAVFVFVILVFTNTEYMALFLLASCVIMNIPGPIGEVESYRLIFCGAVTMAWFMKKILYGQQNDAYRFDSNILALPILAFTLILFICYFATPYKSLSGINFLMHLGCFGTLFMFSDLCKKEAFRKKVIICLFTAALFASLVAILQYLIMQFNMFLPLGRLVIPEVNRRDIVDEVVSGVLVFRSMGTFAHPNLLGMFLALVFPLAAVTYIYLRKKSIKILLGVFLVILSIALFCSNSRSAIMNVAVSLLLISITDIKKTHKIAVILIFLGAVLLAIFSKEIFEYMRLAHPFSYRDILWENGMVLFSEKPFLGYGLGVFPLEYFRRFGVLSLDTMELVTNSLMYYGGTIGEFWLLPAMKGITAHNLYLNYAVETGFSGPLIIFWFYTVFLKWGLPRLRYEKNGYNKALFLGAVAAVSGNFLHGFFESTTVFNLLAIGIPFMAVIALALNIEAQVQDRL